VAVSPSVVLAIVYIAVFATALSFMFWSHGVAELGPSRAGQFVHLMPVFGAALAFVFLGEPLSATQIIGAVLVLTGLVLIEER
jgi:drug/metabolite transporter (DMT)-like permease